MQLPEKSNTLFFLISAFWGIDILIKKDLVHLCDGYYCVLDPAMKYYLNVILWEHAGYV